MAFSWLWGAALYVWDALADFFLSIDPHLIFTTFLPYLNWIVLGAAALIILEGVIRFVIQTGETALVGLLYLLSIPTILLGLVLCRRRPALEALPEEPEVPESPPALLDLDLFRRLSWRESDTPDGKTPANGRSPAERVDTALYELGVPLTASDEEIRSAYRQLLKEHHPDLLRDAPEATKARAREMTIKIRSAYETALGRRGSTRDM